MPISRITDIDRLRRINQALVSRVERSMDQQGNAFTLFQTAINLEGRIKAHTEELRSTLRRLEQSNLELVAAKENAERANQSKTRFLAAASHDVLQPLNAAHLSMSALADLQTTEEGRKLVRQVERSLETMDDLLRTLLDISKLDAGVVRPDVTSVAVEPLFAALRSDFHPLADKRGLRLSIRPATVSVRSDRILLSRILQNIVSNAVRYTTTGGVLVGARSRGATVLIDVADTGCGIPEDERNAIYEEFHRGPLAARGELSGGGLGLGLSIVKRMVDALGHGISFRSVVARGTVFRLELAAAAVPRTEPGSLPAEPDRPRGYGLFGTRVLLIDDDPQVLEAMCVLLERWQCNVRAAATPKEALNHLEDAAWLPDIIIADQHLDRGELGSDVVNRARARLQRDVPALIITADASDDMQRIARTVGAELMYKPVQPAQLRALLAHLLA
jgi:two-component system, sensor histidine kinase